MASFAKEWRNLRVRPLFFHKQLRLDLCLLASNCVGFPSFPSELLLLLALLFPKFDLIAIWGSFRKMLDNYALPPSWAVQGWVEWFKLCGFSVGGSIFIVILGPGQAFDGRVGLTLGRKCELPPGWPTVNRELTPVGRWSHAFVIVSRCGIHNKYFATVFTKSIVNYSSSLNSN